MIEYRILRKEEVEDIERLRREVFNIDFEGNPFFRNKIKEGEIVPIGGFIDNKLVVGCYVSSFYNSIYIEQLFVKKEEQNKGYGSNMVRYIIKNKKYFEDYFKQKFNFSRGEPMNEEATLMLKNLGYKDSNDQFGTMRKGI